MEYLRGNWIPHNLENYMHVHKYPSSVYQAFSLLVGGAWMQGCEPGLVVEHSAWDAEGCGFESHPRQHFIIEKYM